MCRSEAYQSGWRASATPVGGGASRALVVVPVGLIQGLHVPACTWRVSFTYQPSTVTWGLVLSGLGPVALLTAGLALWRRRPRGRPSPVTGAAAVG